MKTKLILSAGALMIALNINAQKGKEFPPIWGKYLTDEQLTLPVKNHKYSIVAIAFSRSAEDELKKWLNPLYDTFMNKPKGKNTMAESHDVNFFFLPVIGGVKMVASKFKETTDKAFWPYVVDTDKTDIKSNQRQLGIEDSKVPYFFVLDKDGKVVEVQSGKLSNDKIDALEEAVE